MRAYDFWLDKPDDLLLKAAARASAASATGFEHSLNRKRLQNANESGMRVNEMFALPSVSVFASQLHEILRKEYGWSNRAPAQEYKDRAIKVEPAGQVIESGADKSQNDRLPFSHPYESMRGKKIKKINRAVYASRASIEALACEYLLKKYVPEYCDEVTPRTLGDITKPVIFALPNKAFILYHPASSDSCAVTANVISDEHKISDQLILEYLEFNSARYFAYSNPEVIVVSSPKEFYDSVIKRYAKNVPAEHDFIAEFEGIREQGM